MPSKRKRSGPGYSRDAPADGAGYKRTKPAYHQVYRLPSRNISGAGIFVTCVQGKERKAALQFIDMLNEVADRIYPGIAPQPVPDPKPTTLAASSAVEAEDDMDALRNGATTPAVPAVAAVSTSTQTDGKLETVESDKAEKKVKEDDIEAQIAAELQDIKSTERRGRSAGKAVRFRSVETDTECLVFISVAPPFDPYLLTYTILQEAETTGVARSRFVQRLTPVAATCAANANDLADLARSVLPAFFSTEAGAGTTFKIDPRIRSHSQLKRNDVIQVIAANMPTAQPEHEGGERLRIHTANLNDPQLWIVVEVVKNAAAISVLRDYNRFKKLNLQSLAQAKEGAQADGRVANNLVHSHRHPKTEVEIPTETPKEAAQNNDVPEQETKEVESEHKAPADPEDMSAFRLF